MPSFLAAVLLPVLAFAQPAAPADPVLAEPSFWSDPGFQRRFVESYLSETEIEPRLDDAERKVMQKVLEHMAADETDKALALLDRNRNPASNAVYDFTVANIRFQQESLDDAAAAYGLAVEKFPKFRRAWRNLGLVRVRQGDYAAALPALRKVVELGGGDAILYGYLGYACSTLGDSLSAESAYRMAILLDPETIDWKLGLAESLFRQERFADVAALCGRLIADDPDNAALWLHQANAFIGLERPLRAAENYEIVDALGGSTADSLNMLGDIYVNESLFDVAADAYVRALRKDEAATTERAVRGARVMTARGAHAQGRRLLDAVEELRGGRIADAERKELLKLRARIAVAEGAGDEEARVLEEVVALDPLDGEALILLGQHAGRAGEIERAIFWFERAEGLEDFEADAKVRHAQLLVGQSRYAEAIPLLRSAQQLKPRDAVADYLEQVERAAKGR